MKGPLSRRTLILIALLVVGCIVALSILQEAEAQEPPAPCTITVTAESTKHHLSLSVPTDWDFVELQICLDFGRQITIRVQADDGLAKFTEAHIVGFRIVPEGTVCNQSDWSLQPDGWYSWGPFQVSIPLVF